MLDEDVPDSQGWLAFGARSSAQEPLQLVGYDYYAMWTQHNCTVSLQAPQKAPRTVVDHNCWASNGMSGSPLIGQRELDSETAPNEIIQRRATSSVIYAIHTHRHDRRHRQSRALEINLCVYHTLCGWLNFSENFSSRPLDKTDRFRQSLGEHCAAMRDFVPSLVRRA